MRDYQTEKENPNNARKLKKTFSWALIALFISFVAVASSTYAWYVYNTGRHTTNVKLAAGAGVNLQISNAYDGQYGSAAVLSAFTGRLNPVSTNSIVGGFQKVYGFTNGSENTSKLIATIFGEVDASDYYKTSIFLRTNGDLTDVYLSNIGYVDSDENRPISTAIRVGLVTHLPGMDQPVAEEFIFAINTATNPEAEYNTITGEEGYVLDCTKKDGETVKFDPYTSENYCIYDQNLGTTELKPGSLKLCSVEGAGAFAPGQAVQVDIYIWLEGCDQDCTNNLQSQTLSNLALSFACISANP